MLSTSKTQLKSMALTSYFSSTSKEQRWVDQISKKFIREVAIDISEENPICVFNVPRSITIFKPEAYTPKVIALGPYHHMDPGLYHMERYKIACAKSFFNQNHPHHQGNIKFQVLLVDKLKELDPVVRGCYHSYLDFDDNTLSWIVAIDGLFLLNLLRDYVIDVEGNKIGRDSILSRDLMLLENQIPFVLLRSISKTIKSEQNEVEDENELLLMMESFCQANSPLELASISCCYRATSPLHLLDLMYHLIINNSSNTLSSPQDEEEVANEDDSEETEVVEEDTSVICDNIGEIAKVGMKFSIGRKILRPIQVIQDMPWDRILSIFGVKVDEDLGRHEGPTVEEIEIPSVSSLQSYAGITFRSTSGGIRDIKFVEEEATLYLPVITLDVNSETILRNLVAYETAMNYSHSNDHSLSEFADLISGIIDEAEDARLLKQKGIVKSRLTNDQIATLFNGMNKSTMNSSHTIASKVNNYYKKKLLVKTFKFMKNKLFSSRLISHLTTVILLLLLVLYSFCEFYGCSKLFGGSSS